MHAIIYINALSNIAYAKEKLPKGFYHEVCQSMNWLKMGQQKTQESMPCFVWEGGVSYDICIMMGR